MHITNTCRRSGDDENIYSIKSIYNQPSRSALPPSTPWNTGDRVLAWYHHEDARWYDCFVIKVSGDAKSLKGCEWHDIRVKRSPFWTITDIRMITSFVEGSRPSYNPLT